MLDDRCREGAHLARHEAARARRPRRSAAAPRPGDKLNKNAIVTVTVLEVRDAGLEVQAGDDGATGFIKRTDLGRDRDEQRPERFQVGQKFDAMVTGFDRSKKPTFSIKAMQISEEKQAVAQYGSSDSGASLGDILGEALKARDEATRSKRNRERRRRSTAPFYDRRHVALDRQFACVCGRVLGCATSGPLHHGDALGGAE